MTNIPKVSCLTRPAALMECLASRGTITAVVPACARLGRMWSSLRRGTRWSIKRKYKRKLNGKGELAKDSKSMSYFIKNVLPFHITDHTEDAFERVVEGKSTQRARTSTLKSSQVKEVVVNIWRSASSNSGSYCTLKSYTLRIIRTYSSVSCTVLRTVKIVSCFDVFQKLRSVVLWAKMKQSTIFYKSRISH